MMDVAVGLSRHAPLVAGMLLCQLMAPSAVGAVPATEATRFGPAATPVSLQRSSSPTSRTCDWAVALTPATTLRTEKLTNKMLALAIDLPSLASPSCDEPLRAAARDAVATALGPEMDESHPPGGVATTQNVRCVAVFGTVNLLSWRCYVEQAPPGAYLAYGYFGLNAEFGAEGPRFVAPLSLCSATARDELVVEAARRLPKEAREPLERKGSVVGSAPSVYRSDRELLFSFTGSLPHSLAALGHSAIPLRQVRAICAPNGSEEGLAFFAVVASDKRLLTVPER